MAWGGGSHVFRQWISDCLTRTQTSLNFATDVPKVALYGNTITPDQNVSAALSAYNAGQWATAGEVFQAVTWPQGGVATTGGTGLTHFNDTAGAVWWDANDTSSAPACTVANVFGDLLYDDTLTAPVADQGIAFHYYGGVQGVVSGVFTVIWDVNGPWRISV